MVDSLILAALNSVVYFPSTLRKVTFVIHFMPIYALEDRANIPHGYVHHTFVRRVSGGEKINEWRSY
jgi:hypothetical protein